MDPLSSPAMMALDAPASPSKKAAPSKPIFGSSMPVGKSSAMGVETPPPSSPIVTARGPASAFASSSPVKPTQSARPSLTLADLDGSSSMSGDALAGLRALPNSNSEPASSADPSGIAANAITHVIYGSYSDSLLIGRSKPSGQPHSTPADADSSLPTSSQGLGSKPPHHVILPNTAKHVSRLHATIQWVPALPSSSPSRSATSTPSSAQQPATGAFVVRILGQNGLIIDGKRRREGHVLRLTPGKTVLDFFGLAARFDVHPDAVAPLPPVASSSAKAKARATPRASLGSSPSKKARRSLASSLGAAVSSSGGRTIKMPISPASSSPPPAALASSSPSMRKAPATSLKRVRDSSSDEEEDEGDIVERADSPSLGRRARGNRTQLRAGPRTDEHLSDVSSSSDASEDDSDEHDDDDGDSDVQLSDSSSLTPEPEARTQRSKTVEGGKVGSGGIKSIRLVQKKAASKSASSSPAPAAPLIRRSGRSHQRSSSAALMPPPLAASGGSGRSTPVSASSSEAQAAVLQSLARQCVADLAPSYDLQGLLAGAIVFHRTATISASEAVRSVLASNPSLMKGEAGTLPVDHGVAGGAEGEHSSPSPLKAGQRHPLWGAPTLLGPVGADGSTSPRWESIARKAWREKLEMVLQLGSCFGIIQRAGKDSSGHDLECWYYYDREGDEDAERAANLGALAKPMRAALKTHKPIFWKKSAYGQPSAASTSSPSPSPLLGAHAAQTQLVTESQLGSSSPALPLPTAALQAGLVPSSNPSAATAAHAEAAPAPLRERKLPNAALERIWDETQPEEREKSWDPKGDADFAAAGAAAGKRRK